LRYLLRVLFLHCTYVEHGTFTISAFRCLSFFSKFYSEGVLDTALCDNCEVPTRGSV